MSRTSDEGAMNHMMLETYDGDSRNETLREATKVLGMTPMMVTVGPVRFRLRCRVSLTGTSRENDRVRYIWELYYLIQEEL